MRLLSGDVLIRLFLPAVMLLVLVSQANAAPDGKALYEEYCTACHQSEGKGGIGLPLDTSKLEQVSDDYLRKTIRYGRPGRIMPAFQDVSDAQVQAIVSHIRSWSKQPGMVFSPIAVKGDIERGKAVFETNCARCHGKEGSGEGPGTGVTLSRERSFMVMPPAINNPGFLRAAPDAMIKHTVLTGRPGNKMPSFKDILSGQDVNNVVAYVRSFEKQQATPSKRTEDSSPAHIVESPYDFDTTVTNVREALLGANFRIFPDRYLEQGLIDEFSHNTKQISIRFCNFKELYNMLNIEPRLGTVLPCRITVMEKKDGQVILVGANMSAIAHWFNNDELEELGEIMEEIVQEVMEEATL